MRCHRQLITSNSAVALSTVADLPTYALRKRLSERRKCLCSLARIVAATDDAANGFAIEAELLSEAVNDRPEARPSS